MNNLNVPSVEPEPGSSSFVQQGNAYVKPIAFRIAAGILLISSLLSLAGLVLGSAPNLIGLMIDVGLTIALLRLSDSWAGTLLKDFRRGERAGFGIIVHCQPFRLALVRASCERLSEPRHKSKSTRKNCKNQLRSPGMFFFLPRFQSSACLRITSGRWIMRSRIGRLC